jgi:hypothetical protein
MKVVGDKLREWAIYEHSETKADAFGRSAFNRYYYASFLITREMLKKLNPQWASAPHSNIPGILNKSIIDRVRRQIKQIERKKLSDGRDSSKQRYYINTAVAGLSGLLSSAFSVRVTADYEPECRVVKVGHLLTLNDQSLEAAKSWPDKAEAFCKVILKVWRQLGLS